MIPWYRGFKGDILEKDETYTSYIVKGRFQTKGDLLIITELPVMTWTRNYKTFLEDLAQKDIVTDIKEFHKDNSIRFEVTVPGLSHKS